MTEMIKNTISENKYSKLNSYLSIDQTQWCQSYYSQNEQKINEKRRTAKLFINKSIRVIIAVTFLFAGYLLLFNHTVDGSQHNLANERIKQIKINTPQANEQPKVTYKQFKLYTQKQIAFREQQQKETIQAVKNGAITTKYNANMFDKYKNQNKPIAQNKAKKYIQQAPKINGEVQQNGKNELSQLNKNIEMQKHVQTKLISQDIKAQLEASKNKKKKPITNAGYPQIGKKRVNKIESQLNALKQHQIQVLSFQIAKQYLKLGLKQPFPELVQLQRDYYQKKYKLQQTFEIVLKKLELPFCIVIPSYKNAQNKRYQLALVTILRQEYENYRIVYIDDNSPDRTADLVQQFAKDRNLSSEKFKLIRNKYSKGPLQNEYNAGLKQCRDDQIFFLVDGDDGLIGKQTLKLYNHFYQTTNSWFIYGNYIMTGKQLVGMSNTIPQQMLIEKTYRDNAQNCWVTSHPKSYYAMLFHKLNRTNLLDPNQKGKEKQFFQVGTDRAQVYQIVQLSGTKVKYIPQILYLYMQNTPNSLIRTKIKEQKRVVQVLLKNNRQEQVDCLFQQEQCLEARQFLKRKLLKSTAKD